MSLDDQPQRLIEQPALRSVPPAPAPAAPKPTNRRRQVIMGVVAVAVIAAGMTYGRAYWQDDRFMVVTDDAYVQGNIAQVSAKIQGYVSDIAVTENQKVAAGDVLLRLDNGDYKIALDLAQSKISTQTETLKRIDAQTTAAKASVDQAKAQKDASDAALRNAQTVDDRTRNLLTTKAVAQAQVDTADAALDQAKADQAGANALIASAEANVAVMQAQYSESQGGMRAGTCCATGAAQSGFDSVARALRGHHHPSDAAAGRSGQPWADFGRDRAD